MLPAISTTFTHGTDFRTLLQRVGGPLKGTHFLRIPAGKYTFSIQASQSHYSEPRKALPDPFGYTCFEVALFNEKDDWVTSKEPGFGKFSDLWETDGDCAVLPYVPVEQVQGLMETALSL